MKREQISSFAVLLAGLLVALLAALLAASCGKYGYDFADGYQEGDSTASFIETDPNSSLADKSMYGKARVFPGLVGDNVRRLEDSVVLMDLKFDYVSSRDLRVGVVPPPIFSTGLYAPAGELIRVEVPSGVLGLTMQIGVHMDNLTGKVPLRRDPVIYSVKELFPGTNYMRNLYGGTIWIRANVSHDAPVPLKVTGAVRASDFVLGVTNVADWLQDVQANEVPWLELRSKRTVYSVPRSAVFALIQEGKLANMDEIMAEWDTIYEKDFYDWMGLSANAPERRDRYPDLPERGVLDIQPSAGWGHSGNPWVATNARGWLNEWIDLDQIRAGKSWGTYHEVGHNYQQGGIWSWAGNGETTNNLFVFKGLHRNGIKQVGGAHSALGKAFPKALAYAALPTAKNIITDPASNEGDNPFFKLVPFLQIFNKATGKNGEPGWDFMPFLYKAARIQGPLGLDEAKRDFFYRTLCAFTGKDYQRFFIAWGIVISPFARKEMSQQYPSMETAIWEYNPLTDTGGDGPVNPKVDLFNTQWTVTEHSTQDPQTGQATNINDGNTGPIGTPGGATGRIRSRTRSLST